MQKLKPSKKVEVYDNEKGIDNISQKKNKERYNRI